MLLERCERKSFLHRIVTGDEQWANYKNPKREKHGYCQGEQNPSTSKCYIHAQKVMLCLWWDQEGMIYHKLLKPGDTIIAVRYKQKLMKLNQALKNSGKSTLNVMTN